MEVSIIEMKTVKLHIIHKFHFYIILTILCLCNFQNFNCIQLVGKHHLVGYSYTNNSNNAEITFWKQNHRSKVIKKYQNDYSIVSDLIKRRIENRFKETIINSSKSTKESFEPANLTPKGDESFTKSSTEFRKMADGENQNIPLLLPRIRLNNIITRVKKSLNNFKDKENASSVEIPGFSSTLNSYALHNSEAENPALKIGNNLENETNDSNVLNSYKLSSGLHNKTKLLQNPIEDSADYGLPQSVSPTNLLGHEEKELKDETSSTTFATASMDFNRSTKEVETFVETHETQGELRNASELSTQTFMKNSEYSSTLIETVTAASIYVNNTYTKDHPQYTQQEKEMYSYTEFNTNNTQDENTTDINLRIMMNEDELSTQKDERSLTIVEIFYSKYPVEVWKAVGLFEDSYIQDGGIDPHWMKFDAPDPITHTLLAVLYAVIMFVGCGGNLLVLYMFARCRSLRTPANYLICNLAVSDFFMLAKMPIFIFNSLYHGPALGSIGCKLYGFFGGLTGTASIMTLAAIAVDRYYAIVHPLNPFKKTTFKRATLMIIVVWVYSCVFSTMPLLGLNSYVSEGYLTSCSFDYLSTKLTSRIFVFVFFVAAWFVPLCVIIFSYVEIFRIVRQAEKMDFVKDGHEKQSFKNKKSQAKQSAEIKIAVLSTAVIFLWICSWTPYAVLALLGIFGQYKYITPFVSAIPALFCKTASCIDPFLYAINHPRFQRELKVRFNRLLPFKRNTTSKSKGSSRYNSFITATCAASMGKLNSQNEESSGSIKCSPGDSRNDLVEHSVCTTNDPTTGKESNKIYSLVKHMEKNTEESQKLDEIEMGRLSLERLDRSPSRVVATHAFMVEVTAEDLRNKSCENRQMTKKVTDKDTEILQCSNSTSMNNRLSITLSESLNFQTEVFL